MFKNWKFVGLILFIIAQLCFTAPFPVYSIHYITSFRNDKISTNFGCTQSVAYGYFQYPEGNTDALHVLTAPYQYSQQLNNCPHKEVFSILFGSGQNYELLLNVEASGVANVVKNSIKDKNVIIDWDYLEKKNIKKAMQWLNKFIAQLNGFTVYLKAPASYFCYTQNDKKYIIDVKCDNFIIEMHGQDADSYQSYEDVFERENKKTKDQNYPDQKCPKYPSYKSLKSYKGNYFIETTLQTQEAGYFGTEFSEFINKSATIYTKEKYFYDSYPNIVISF